jgi:hypothetical protein
MKTYGGAYGRQGAMTKHRSVYGTHINMYDLLKSNKN